MSKDGLVRVGEEVEPEKLEELDVDQWCTGPWTGQQHTDNLTKLKLYAYACKQQLGGIIYLSLSNLVKHYPLTFIVLYSKFKFP